MSIDTPSENIAPDTTAAAILGRVGEAVFAIDTDWQFTYVNEQAATLVDRDPASLLGKSLWEQFPDVADSPAYEEFHAAVESGQPRRFEMAYEPRDAWFTVRAYPSPDGVTVCFHEVTEERQRELELQRSRRLFESVFDETNDAIVIADTDRRITEFNPAAERLFGYDAPEVIGEQSEVLYADTTEFERQGAQRYNEQAAERHDRYVTEYERADGTTFEGETVGTPLEGQDGETFAFFATIRNVTKRLEYERDIERRNRALKQFHEITTDESTPFETQVAAVLDVATEYLGLETGVLAETDDRTHIPRHVVAPEGATVARERRPLESTFCERMTTAGESFGFHDATEAGVDDHPAAEQWDIASYLGVPVHIDDEQYGTLSFASVSERTEPFSESEETFVRIVGQWAGKELSRQRTRERAERERERLRQIIDMLPQLVFAKDDSGTFLLANEAVAEAYGTTVAELEGSTDADFADSKEEVEQFRADDRAVIESGEAKYIPEEPLTTADGDEKIMATRKIPYDPVDTDGDAVLGVSTDITELKQREAELEVQSAAMEASMDGISILDADGEYIYMNEAHASVFDHEPAELIGSSWRQVYDDAEIERLEQEVLPALDREGQWRGETVGRRHDGSPVDQEITLSLLEDGKLICTNRDITARKARQSELEQYEALIESMNESAFIVDEDSRLVYANEQALAYAGVEPSAVIGEHLGDLVEEMVTDVHAADGFVDALDATLDGEQVDERHELPLATPSGEYVLEYILSPFTDGSEQRAAIVARDITEQKDREQELGQKQSRLRALFDESPDGIIVHDERGEILDANTTQADLLGYAPDELRSMNVAKVEAGIGRPELRELWDGMAIGETQKVEGNHRRKSGAIYPVEVWVSKTELRGQPRFIAISRDISERKSRERDMVRNREFLEKTQEIASVGGWEIDLRTDELRWTEEVYQIHDLPPDTEVTVEDGIDYYHPDDRSTITEVFERLTEAGEPYDEELRIVTESDEVRWVRTIGDPQFDGDEVVGVRGIFQDITERKQQEEQLRTVQQRFERFSETVPNAFFLVSPDYETTHYINAAAAEIYGADTTDDASALDRWTQHVHPDDLTRLRATLRAQQAGVADWPIEQEFRVQLPERGARWIQSQLHPVRDKDGTVIEIAGVSTDITDRKRLEQSLRENEASLRDVTQIASDTDREFEDKLAAVIELGCERLDLPYGFLNRIEDETQHVVEAVGTHPGLQSGETAPLSEAYCRKTIQQDVPLTVQNAIEEGWEGDPAYDSFGLGCYIGGKIVVNGETYGTLCFADHEGRGHQFDELERAFVELLVQWISYELAGETVETKLRELNETAQRLLSAGDADEVASVAIESAKEVLNLPMTGLWWFDEEADALVPAGMTEEATALLDTQPTFNEGDSLAWQTLQDGEMRIYDDLQEATGRFNEDTPLQSEILVPLGDHGLLISGATRPRAFSETDRGLFEILGATVETALNRAEREQELRDTRERLEQSNQELEQFAYAASHDLQEPLRTVSSYLTLLERRNRDVLDEDAVDFIDFAVDGADRMQEMIQALLEYSRVETRSQEFEPTDMDAVFRTVTQNLEVTIDERGAAVDLPDSPGHVTGDPSQLVQLFQNLVENGIKYSDGDPKVAISVSRSDGDVIEYAVADDGIGMDPGQLEDIFEVFQRLHTREEFDGTGIGLSICRKIVDRHDGELRVESAPGAGSTFFVTLPVAGENDE